MKQMDTRENRTNTSNLTNDEVAQAASLLARLEPGFLPFPIFLQVCRLTTMTTVELILLRRRPDGTVETWLRRRADDDTLWPGKWCNPGCVIRPTDHLEDTFTRLIADDLSGTPFAGEPQFVTYMLNRSRRGQTGSPLYWVELAEEPAHGQYFPVDALPDDMVQDQKVLIEAAVRHYTDHQTDR